MYPGGNSSWHQAQGAVSSQNPWILGLPRVSPSSRAPKGWSGTGWVYEFIHFPPKITWEQRLPKYCEPILRTIQEREYSHSKQAGKTLKSHQTNSRGCDPSHPTSLWNHFIKIPPKTQLGAPKSPPPAQGTGLVPSPLSTFLARIPNFSHRERPNTGRERGRNEQFQGGIKAGSDSQLLDLGVVHEV